MVSPRVLAVCSALALKFPSRAGFRGVVAAAISWIAISFSATIAVAAAPTIGAISLRGLQIGATTTIAIDGADLAPDLQIVLPMAIAKQVVRPGATPQHAELEVTLPADVSPGMYNLRVSTAGGLSAAILIGVDSLVQTTVIPRLSSLPVALSGAISGGQVGQTTFTLKKGEGIAIEVEARRIGGGLDPVLNVFNDRHVPLAWAEASTALGGDARLQFTAPADGLYTLQMHDSVYQAAGANQYRLKIGDWQFADTTLPMAIRRGAKATVEFASTNLPAGSKTELAMPEAADELPASFPTGYRAAGLRPRVLASDVDEVVKKPSVDGSPQQVTAPIGISGRLDKPQSEDVYRVEVAPNVKLRIEVMASRLGSPLDGVLTIRDDKGNQLATADDQPMTVDPGLDFTVPGGATAILVAVKDVAGRAGADFVYHLAISKTDLPSFSLSLADERVLIPAGGAAVVRVTANRSNYAGPIKVNFEGLPPGVTSIGGEISAGSNMGFLPLSAAGDGAAHGIARVVGVGVDTGATIHRIAESSIATADTARQPWLRGEVAISRIAAPGIGLAWSGVSGQPELKAGGKTPLAIKLTRGPGAAGPVRISSITTQTTPKKKVKVNNQDVEQDDLDRTLRLEAAPTIAADQSDATLQFLVPGDLAPSSYDIVVRGELLSADGKSVLATTVTPILRARIIAPPPEPKPPVVAGAAQPLKIFEDEADFVGKLNQGAGQITLVSDDKFSGAAAVKVTPDQRFNPAIPGLSAKIRQNPGPGEFRFMQFAWKKKGGVAICLQLSHDGAWGPVGDPAHKFRYHAGPGPECYGGSLAVDPKLPDGWTLVTRDLFADFGEFTLTGIALSTIDGEYGLFDHMYLGRAAADFDAMKK